MDNIDDIRDEDFIPFLHGLGVETYKKSFEWMLNDSDFSGVLQWIYNNLDHNNALTAREECRYAELEKKGKLLSPDNLETQILSIQEEFEGLVLAGDLDSLEDAKLDIIRQKEKLAMLQMHEDMINEMIAQDESTKEDLTLDIARLETVQKQCNLDVNTVSEQCLQLAEEVENITSSVMNVIADVLNVYGSSINDKELSKQFFTFGPLESYRQTQSLFKSHFDLYTNKKFNDRQTDANEDDLRTALIEAKDMEERLSDAVCTYIESKAELSGELAKLMLVSNYSHVHSSDITVCSLEAQSAISLLEQEECILEQQLLSTVKLYSEARTRLAVSTSTTSAMMIRRQIYKDLSYLVDVCQQAVTLDRLVYYALRRELRTMEDVMQFAAHLRLYVIQEREIVADRIKSMTDICTEQENVERNLQKSNILLQSLSSILGVNSTDVSLYAKTYNEIMSRGNQLKENITEEYKRKENDLMLYKNSSAHLRSYIYDGCTKQPNCNNTIVSAMRHRLTQDRDAVDERIVETSVLFNDIKKNDKNNLRKLWQWFLTDQSKLLATIKNTRG
ncbi:augmin complex subunit dgt3 [Danaus plexippus]|uniref:augmin complex subunit dgt3 n=1 Tax=Danaus plexippus TaxID=13037 RepID=UPI002AB31AAA|nr:augmin complex subunit dgt3 [Danaus plexippus]